MGKKLLAAGQLADALSHFHAAIGMYFRKRQVTLVLEYLCLDFCFGFVLFASWSILISCKFWESQKLGYLYAAILNLDRSQQRCTKIWKRYCMNIVTTVLQARCTKSLQSIVVSFDKVLPLSDPIKIRFYLYEVLYVFARLCLSRQESFLSRNLKNSTS